MDADDLDAEIINSAKSTSRNITILHQGLCNSQWNYTSHGKDWNCTVAIFINKCSQGLMQSPINILTSESEYFVPLDKPILTSLADGRDFETFRFENNGYTIQVKGELGTITLFPHNVVYKAEQLHFHLPSEHRIDGQVFDMEMHVVCSIGDETDLSSTVTPNLILVYFFKMDRNSKDNQFISKIFGNVIPKVGEIFEKTTKLDFALLNDKAMEFPDSSNWACPFALSNKQKISSLLREKYKRTKKDFSIERFFLYYGSFTTPSCEESVTYVLKAMPFHISSAQWHSLKDKIASGYAPSGNNREIQSSNFRQIFHYDGLKDFEKFLTGVMKLEDEKFCEFIEEISQDDSILTGYLSSFDHFEDMKKKMKKIK